MVLSGRSKGQGIRTQLCNKAHRGRGFTSQGSLPLYPYRAGPVRAARVSQKPTLPNKYIMMAQVQGQDRRLSQDQVQKR